MSRIAMGISRLTNIEMDATAKMTGAPQSLSNPFKSPVAPVTMIRAVEIKQNSMVVTI